MSLEAKKKKIKPNQNQHLLKNTLTLSLSLSFFLLYKEFIVINVQRDAQHVIEISPQTTINLSQVKSRANERHKTRQDDTNWSPLTIKRSYICPYEYAHMNTVRRMIGSFSWIIHIMSSRVFNVHHKNHVYSRENIKLHLYFIKWWLWWEGIVRIVC